MEKFAESDSSYQTRSDAKNHFLGLEPLTVIKSVVDSPRFSIDAEAEHSIQVK